MLTDYKMINDLVGTVFGYEHGVDQTFTKVRDVRGEFGVFHKREPFVRCLGGS